MTKRQLKKIIKEEYKKVISEEMDQRVMPSKKYKSRMIAFYVGDLLKKSKVKDVKESGNAIEIILSDGSIRIEGDYTITLNGKDV